MELDMIREFVSYWTILGLIAAGLNPDMLWRKGFTAKPNWFIVVACGPMTWIFMGIAWTYVMLRFRLKNKD